MQSKAVSVLSAACIVGTATIASATNLTKLASVPGALHVRRGLRHSQPKGEFASNVPTGYGFDANGQFKIDSKGWLSLRADGGSVRYGHEQIPLGFFNRYQLNLDTNNTIEFGAIGLQFQFPDGWLRPYAKRVLRRSAPQDRILCLESG